MTVHFKHTVRSMTAKFPDAFTWSPESRANTLSATMCGIPAVKHGKPVDCGEHTDQWEHVTCADCHRIRANVDEVLRKGWAGKAIRDVEVKP